MREEIRKYNPEGEYFIKEQCHVNELSNSTNDEGVSIALVRVRPGIRTNWHKLSGIAERYVILEGSGLVEVGSIKQSVSSNDVVIIPPDCRQRIFNSGTGDLIFLAVCSPRFKHSAYVDLSEQEKGS